jgi:uncharacterized protein (DUF697 family)
MAARNKPQRATKDATAADVTNTTASGTRSRGKAATTKAEPATKAEPTRRAVKATAANGPAKGSKTAGRAAKQSKSTAAPEPTAAAPDPTAATTQPAAAPVGIADTTISRVDAPQSVESHAHPAAVSGELIPASTTAVVPSWQEFKEKPGYAAELLAQAAVARFGGPARANVTWLRDTYPNATPDGLARVAVQRFVRQARNSGFVTGLAGPLAVLADAGALNIIHARLILHIAAAYGMDPGSPERAAEILVLQGIHSDVTAARATLQAADGEGDPHNGNHSAQGSTVERHSGAAPDPRRLATPLARTIGMAAVRIGVRRALRVVPGAGALVGAAANVRSTEAVAERAIRYYRSPRTTTGSGQST